MSHDTEPGEAAAPKRDKFAFSYSIWVGLIFLLWSFSDELDRIFNLWLLMVPIVFLPTIGVAIGLLIGLVWNAYKRRWRKLASVVAAPFVNVALFSLLGYAGIDPQWIRFQLSKDYYREQIAKAAFRPNEPRFMTFAWGERGGVAVANFFYTLVFDESDEISRPCGERSQAWRLRVGARWGTCLQPEDDHHSVSIRKLEDHFYVATEIYQ